MKSHVKGQLAAIIVKFAFWQSEFLTENTTLAFSPSHFISLLITNNLLLFAPICIKVSPGFALTCVHMRNKKEEAILERVLDKEKLILLSNIL